MNEEELEKRLSRIESKIDELLHRPLTDEQVYKINTNFYEQLRQDLERSGQEVWQKERCLIQ